MRDVISYRGGRWARRSAAAIAMLALCASASAPAADAPKPKPKPARTAPARTNVNYGNAPDFAPGVWTDGAEHHISDYKGKVLLVFSFDPKYVDSPADVRKKLQTYDLFIRDKPVAVVGIITGPRDITMSKSLIKPVDVNAPMFFDNISQTSRNYAAGSYSVYVRMVDAEGNLASSYNVTPAEVDAALKNVNWKYRDSGYDKRLDAIVDLFEWNHYEAGIKKLQPLRKSSNKEVAAAAEKLYLDVRAECEKWEEEADGQKETEPARAYDLYVRLSAIFPGDELGKSADEALKQLKGNKALQDELAARQMFARLYDVMPRAKFAQRVDAADYCESISKKYPNTPTAAKAKQIATDLMNQRSVD